MGKTHTWKPPDQSSLHDICRTGMRFIEAMQTYFSSEDKGRGTINWLTHTGRSSVADRSARRPQRSIQRMPQREDQNGGAERDRTADPLLAKQVLSQLSYSPNSLGTAQADKRQQKARSSTPFPHIRSDPAIIHPKQPQIRSPIQDDSPSAIVGRPVRSIAPEDR